MGINVSNSSMTLVPIPSYSVLIGGNLISWKKTKRAVMFDIPHNSVPDSYMESVLLNSVLLLTDIIWGETGESDDHIVPHPDGSEGKAPSYGDNIKKEWAVEASNIKPTDQKKSTTKTDLSNIKLDGSSKHDSGGASITAGCRMELGADLSLTNATKSNQYSLGAEASNNLTEVPKHECLRDEGNRLGDDSRVLHHQNEELEQGDFIDYGWANIGSFDDLDKIFRVVRGVLSSEKIFIGGNFNRHIGSVPRGYAVVHGGFDFYSFGFCEVLLVVVVNSNFLKKEDYLITFWSAVVKTQIDFLLLRKGDRAMCKDCKVIPG
ncbi:hypothetical protein FXO37_27165 [Capsicum annuum]|nr:hypothetical protein FXO37_27165 [Capsicum annuum]